MFETIQTAFEATQKEKAETRQWLQSAPHLVPGAILA